MFIAVIKIIIICIFIFGGFISGYCVGFDKGYEEGYSNGRRHM